MGGAQPLCYTVPTIEKGKDGMEHLLSITDLGAEEIRSLIEKAIELKRADSRPLLNGKSVAMLFEKPSLRTRVSFDIAMQQLGGHALYLSPAEVGLGQREPAADVARVLSRYVDGIVARTFGHETVEALARWSTVPVINALSDREHPCQILADLLTVQEKKGTIEGLVVTYIGDANNVANSLLLACCIVGIDFRFASPKGYQFADDILALARRNGCQLVSTEEPEKAVIGADVVYTDVWTSMGQEAESDRRRRAFAGYQVTPDLLSLAKPDAIFMHPLPAHHGEEVAEGVLDAPQSVVFDQAENRLHMQKALLATLLGAP